MFDDSIGADFFLTPFYTLFANNQAAGRLLASYLVDYSAKLCCSLLKSNSPNQMISSNSGE